MKQILPTFAVIAAAAALTACDTRENRSTSPTGSTATQAPAQLAPPKMTAAPADTAPATAVAPMPAPSAAEGAPTAQDKASPDPLKAMTTAEESKTMPMALQGNNHSSPSVEPAKK